MHVISVCGVRVDIFKISNDLVSTYITMAVKFLQKKFNEVEN